MADSSHRHAPQAMISRQGFLNLSGDVCFVPCYFRKNEHDFRNCNTFSEAITKIRGVQNPTGLALRAVITDVLGGCFLRVVFSKGRKTNPSAKKQGPSKNRGVLVFRVVFSRQWHAGRGSSGPAGSSERRSPMGTSAQMTLLVNSEEKKLACLASNRRRTNSASQPTESRKLCMRACVRA